jgi:hypothetical protein
MTGLEQAAFNLIIDAMKRGGELSQLMCDLRSALLDEDPDIDVHTVFSAIDPNTDFS